MTRRGSFRLVLATVLTLIGTSLAWPTNPASAATRITISTPNTSTVGHVKGTITTTAPYVAIQPLYFGSPYVDPVVVATAGGVGTYNIPTWGWYPSDPFALGVRACSGAQLASCESDESQSTEFTPTSVDPTVTWPAKTTYGPGEDFAVTISDPNGGGALYGVWNGYWTELSRNGRSVVDLMGDGTGDFLIVRCDKVDGALCMTTEAFRTLNVHKSTSGTVIDYSASYVETRRNKRSRSDLNDSLSGHVRLELLRGVVARRHLHPTARSRLRAHGSRLGLAWHE